MMNGYNAYDKYKEQSVMTMTHGEMLIKLYEGAIRQLNAGVSHMESENVVETSNALRKAQNIISYLRATLDFKYPVSNGLASLYHFFIERIIDANLNNDAATLREIIPMIEELRDTFIQGDKLARIEKQKSVPAMRIG